MNKQVQIGIYRLEEDTKFTDRGYATASWMETISVLAGDYPVMATFEEQNEWCIQYKDIRVTLPGTVVSDYFGTEFCGNQIGEYDGKKNAGKQSSYTLHHWGYSLAYDKILGANPRFILDGNVEPALLKFYWKPRNEWNESAVLETKAPSTVHRILIDKYRQAQSICRNFEEVKCQMSQVDKNLGLLWQGCPITSSQVAWVDYFIEHYESKTGTLSEAVV